MVSNSTLGPRTKLLKFIDYLLRFSGQNVFYDNWYSKFLSITLLITLSIILILASIEPFTMFNMTKLTEFFELFGPYYQGLIKILVHKYYMRLIRQLLKEMDDNFWPLEKYSEKLKQKRLQTFKMLYYYSTTLFFGMLSCMTVLIIVPMTSPIRRTPFNCYQLINYEDSIGYYLFVYGTQFFNMFFGGMLVTAYDGLFLDFVARLLFELMVLSEKIQELNLEEVKSKKDEEKKYGKVKEYVQHHILLLRMFNHIKKIYSLIFMCQFLSSTVTLCIGLYNISTGNGLSVLALRGFSFSGTFFIQLSMYCIAGSMIEYQCEKVADFAFSSNWQEPCGDRIKKGIMMIILRSRRTPKLTAGNIMYANLNALGKILQFSISFYTLLSKEKKGASFPN